MKNETDIYQKIDDYILRLIRESSPARTIWNVERIRQNKPADWNYIDGCMITALLAMSEISGDPAYFDFAERFISDFISEDGAIRTYDPEKYNLDDINEGRVLFPLYERTGKEKYRKAADRLYAQLLKQPRTFEGSFWHKAIYPNQVWLDGLYMALPFYATYSLRFGDGNTEDIVKQVNIVRERMFDEKKRLCYHGYDAERRIFWADPATGLSKNFWLRSIGWLAVALADLSQILPEGDGRDRIVAVFREVLEGISEYADPDTGMYYQVVDQGGREGNYLETSGSSMIAYAALKGARLQLLPEVFREKGERTFRGIAEHKLSFTGKELNLGGICLVAGLGPVENTRRDGSYAYYISEPVVENDAKGVAPFILCYTEIKRLYNGNTKATQRG